MSSGYIKLHRSLLDNVVFQNDPTAAYIFVTLLLLVDRRTGVYNGGRFKLADLTSTKPITCYKALKRLEEYMMVKLIGNARYTQIILINWEKYQSSETLVKRSLNAEETPDNTKQEVRSKKKVLTKVNTQLTVDKRDPQITQLISHFEAKINKMPYAGQQAFAASELIKQHGFDKSIGAINAVAASRGQKYAPNIASLEELRDKWVKLENFFARENNGLKGVKIR